MENKLNIVEFDSLDELLEDLNVEEGEGHFQDKIENEYPDVNVLFDVNLNEVLKYLEDAGYSDEEIIQMNNNQYGNVVDLYKVGVNEDSLYVLIVGSH